MDLMWIEFKKKYDRWKVGDKSQQGTSKALGYIRRGLAIECKAPSPPKPVREVETTQAAKPVKLEAAHVTPQPRRRERSARREDKKTGGDL